MNVLDKYAVINCYTLHEAPVEVYKPPERIKTKILSDIKKITVAEIDPVSRDLITAHRLQDYRRKTFSLWLLPDIKLPIDSLLSELPSLDSIEGFGSNE